MTESIGKLRELCAKWRKTSITPGRNPAADEVDAIADEIEREIAERYMKLPVDADGVPIKPGHRIELDFKGGEVWLVGTQDVMCNDGISYRACAVKHYIKPRTIEDVLKEFGDWYKHVAGGCDEPGIIANYADELRGMGVGE